MLKSQDIVVLLKLAVAEPEWTFLRIASELGLSPSVVHRSVERAERSGLYDGTRRSVDRRALLEFLTHGAKYLFPPAMLGEARGFPTAWAAPPLVNQISSSGQNVPVWAHAMGSTRGIALAPIHTAVPDATRKDPKLGELLALFDAIRIGNAREQELATKLLGESLDPKALST
jgi:DNA-binding Lrp family transcriptional regulator